MRIRIVVLLAALLAVTATAGAATDSAVAYASLTVEETLTVDLNWMSTGTDTINLGVVPLGPDSPAVEQLRMSISHNLDATTPLDISISVDKSAGPTDNRDDVTIENSDLGTNTWNDGNWGSPLPFYVDGDAQSYTYDLNCVFLVYTDATPSVRTYEITATVTSL